jgi:hypothetical protein
VDQDQEHGPSGNRARDADRAQEAAVSKETSMKTKHRPGPPMTLGNVRERPSERSRID